MVPVSQFPPCSSVISPLTLISSASRVVYFSLVSINSGLGGGSGSLIWAGGADCWEAYSSYFRGVEGDGGLFVHGCLSGKGLLREGAAQIPDRRLHRHFFSHGLSAKGEFHGGEGLPRRRLDRKRSGPAPGNTAALVDTRVDV